MKGKLKPPAFVQNLKIEARHEREKSFSWSRRGSLDFDGLKIKEIGLISVDGEPIFTNNSEGHGTKSTVSNTIQHEYNASTLIRLEQLGKGAGGVVYKAVHAETLQLVAIKEILMHNKGRRRQLASELKVLHAMLRHMENENGGGGGNGGSKRPPAPPPRSSGGAQRVVRFYNAYALGAESKVCIAMQYLDGGSLQEVVAEARGCRRGRWRASPTTAWRGWRTSTGASTCTGT